MKKAGLSIAAVIALGLGSASAADLGKVYKKAPPPVVAVPAWDIAFGSAVMSDYVFRGVTQSNHKPSVTAYFEPRYNINPNLQLYVGSSFESIHSRIAPLLKSISTAVSVQPSATRTRHRCLRLPVSRWNLLLRRSRLWRPRVLWQCDFSERQLHEEGRQLL